MELFFYLFGFLLIFSSFMVVFSKNHINSAMWLILSFCNGALLFLILGAEYLAMLLIIVYVGAVAVLFLFVIMLVDQSKRQKISVNLFEVVSCICVSLVFFVNIAFLSISYFGKSEPPSVNSVKIANKITYIDLASVIYTDFVVAFQISGLILLLAMIGCIAISFDKTVRKIQNYLSQISRDKKNCTENKNIKSWSSVDV